MQKGKASIIFDRAPYIFSAASIVGQKEGEDLWEAALIR